MGNVGIEVVARLIVATVARVRVMTRIVENLIRP
jgi:hypothetical protein